MCYMFTVTFVFLTFMICQDEIHCLAENPIINDDDYISHGNEDTIKKHVNDLHIAAAIRRGIEKIVSESPLHRNKIQRENLINKIGDLIFPNDNVNSLNINNELRPVHAAIENVEKVPNLEESQLKKEYTDYGNQNKLQIGEKKSDIGESRSLLKAIDRKANVNSTKRGLFTKQKPFEGYMKKLSVDVSGVMGDAKDMLRDTGKLIHGLKRVVKGASILTSFTNNAVKYAKYFSAEPSNVTIDYLEEKAIIALLDAQKAANESKKAAKLARVASAKAIDTEKRIESREGELQDEKAIIPFVKATEILATKAEKAAKLAQLEKQKTEKDFVIMNRHLSGMSHVLNKQPRIEDPSESMQDLSTVPDESYFYMKQKQLEKNLLSGSKQTGDESKSNLKSDRKALKDDNELKYIADLKTNISHMNKEQEESKDAVTSIAAELSLTQQNKNDEMNSIAKEANSEPEDDHEAHVKEDIVGSEEELDDYNSPTVSHGKIKEQNNDSGKEKLKEAIIEEDENGSGASENTIVSSNELKQDISKNLAANRKSGEENQDTPPQYITSKIIQKSIQPAQFWSERSEKDSTNAFQQEKKSDLSPGNGYQGVVMSEETLRDDTSSEELKSKQRRKHLARLMKSDISEVPKDEKKYVGPNKIANEERMLLNYLDEDISGSADSSGETDSSGNDESSTVGSTTEVNIPVRNLLVTDNIPDEKFSIPKVSQNKETKNNEQKKENIERSFDLIDPFGFNEFVGSKEVSHERNYISIPGNNGRNKIKVLSVPDYTSNDILI